MTPRRPYREACSSDDALGELRRRAGSQFDPRCVKALADIVGAADGARNERPALADALQPGAAAAKWSLPRA